MDDFLEPHNLRCRNCHNVFVTVLSINSIEQGRVHCPKCRGNAHEILDEAKTINIPTTRNTSSDLYDSLLYAASQYKNRTITDNDYITTVDEFGRIINIMEDKNMKRTEKEEQKDMNVVITRRCDTSRGVFTVEQLEATDLFVCVGDEKQTIYMAVTDPNNEPKYKTRKPVVNIETGEIWYFDNNTKVYVYKAGCELRVGEFIWSSEGYN